MLAGLWLGLLVLLVGSPSRAANFQVNGPHQINLKRSNLLTPLEVQKLSSGPLQINARLQVIRWTDAVIGVGNPSFTLTDDSDRASITIIFGAKRADTTVAMLVITDGMTADSVLITAWDTMLTITQPERDYKVENQWEIKPVVVGYGDLIGTSTNANIGIYNAQRTPIDVTATIVGTSAWTITTPTIHVAAPNSMYPVPGYLRMELTRTGNRYDTAVVALECLAPVLQRDTMLVISIDTAVHSTARKGIDLYGTTKQLAFQTSSASSSQRFTFVNTLSTTIAVAQVHTSFNDHFQVTATKPAMLPIQLAPNATLDVTINFIAANPGAFTDVLEILTGDMTTYSFPLTGVRSEAAAVIEDANRPALAVYSSTTGFRAVTSSAARFTLVDMLGRTVATSDGSATEWIRSEHVARGAYIIIAAGTQEGVPFRLIRRIELQ